MAAILLNNSILFGSEDHGGFAGYVLVKFNHHMQAVRNDETVGDKEYHTMQCNYCGYTYRSTHDEIEPYGIESGMYKYNYDTAGSLDEIEEKEKNKIFTYDGKKLVYYFGPATTANDLSQYLLAIEGYELDFQYDEEWFYRVKKTKGYVCGSMFPNDGDMLSMDNKSCYFVNETVVYLFPLYSHDQSETETLIIRKEDVYGGSMSIGSFAYNIIAIYDENAPKEGYFRYWGEEEKVEIASFKEIVTQELWTGNLADGYVLSAKQIEGSKYFTFDDDAAVFHCTEGTTLGQITQYFIGRTQWTVTKTEHSMSGEFAEIGDAIYGYHLNRNKKDKYYTYDITASGYLASRTSVNDTTLVKDVAESVTIDGKTYYRIPLYSHSNSTMTLNRGSTSLAQGATFYNVTLKSVSTTPVAYLLVLTDGEYSYGKFTGSDVDDGAISVDDVYAKGIVKNTNSDWNENLDYYEMRQGYVKLLTKPENWPTAYGAYYICAFAPVTSKVEWELGPYYEYDGENDKFVLLTEEPEGWDYSYVDYYYVREYTENASDSVWAEGRYYAYEGGKYVLVNEEPSDWASVCGNYYHIERFVPNTSSTWQRGEYYRFVEGYYGILSQPADWAENYENYYIETYLKTSSFGSSEILREYYKAVPMFEKNRYYERMATGEYQLMDGEPSDWVRNYKNYYECTMVNEEPRYNSVIIHPGDDYYYVRLNAIKDNNLPYGPYYRLSDGGYVEIVESEYVIYKNEKLVRMTEDDWVPGLKV